METFKLIPPVAFLLLACNSAQTACGADDGAKIYHEVCAQCHTTKRNPLEGKHLTRDQWNEAIGRMVAYGAEIPKGKLPELLDFLARLAD